MQKNLDIKKHLIIALDLPTMEEALQTADELKDSVEYLKVGKQLFTAAGPELIRKLIKRGFKIFLDLKFHDIPNTVSSAAIEAAKLGVNMFNIHISGGRDMINQTVDNLTDYCSRNKIKRPLAIGVTVLTSLDDNNLHELGIGNNVEAQVKLLAKFGKDCGLDGVVASAREIKTIREVCGMDFKIITPGIRPAWAAKGDQKRVVTPEQAIASGADYIVIGRPVTRAKNKTEAVSKLLEKDL